MISFDIFDPTAANVPNIIVIVEILFELQMKNFSFLWYKIQCLFEMIIMHSTLEPHDWPLSFKWMCKLLVDGLLRVCYSIWNIENSVFGITYFHVSNVDSIELLRTYAEMKCLQSSDKIEN